MKKKNKQTKKTRYLINSSNVTCVLNSPNRGVIHLSYFFTPPTDEGGEGYSVYFYYKTSFRKVGFIIRAR